MIRLKRLNAMNLKVRDLEASLRWYREHFGFERQYDVEGGVVVSVGGIDLVLSPHADPTAPLADPREVRCIHTLGLQVTEPEFRKAHQEFAGDPGIVEFDQPEFKSFITSDPDDYCVEIYFDKQRKKRIANKASHATSEPAPGAASSAREEGMTKNIFIVEGLPGVGKSYFCEILQREIRDRTGSTEIFFFEERDTDHPFHCSEQDIGGDIWSIDYSDCFRIVERKCHEFFAGTYRADEIYVFDCGPLQRPLFYSMIMSDFSEEATLSHLLKLHRSYENLPFQVFYLESEDFMRDFESIYRSRGSDYRDHIDKAWNNSRYGTKQNLTGLEGAMRVLAYFKELKERFIHRLDLSPAIIVNTAKDPDILRNRTREMLGTT